MNQYYSEELSQKTRRGLKETLLKGKLPGGRVAFGWDKTLDRKAVINEAEAAIVREIFNTYLSGKTMEQIALDLNERGIINKDRPFLQCTIYTILHNEKYAGIMRVRDEVFEGVYPPIITKEIYEKTQKLLFQNSVGKHAPPDKTYLLRNKVDCPYCGRHFNSAGGADRNGFIRRYYKCINPACKGHKSIRKEELEETVIHAINEVFGTEEQIDRYATGVVKKYQENAASNSVLRIYENELEKVQKAIDGFLKAIAMGVITESTKERLETLEKQKHELTENIAIEKANQAAIITKEQVKEKIRRALKNPTQRVVDLFVARVAVYDDHVDIGFKAVPYDMPPKRRKYSESNENPDPCGRGSLYMEFDNTFTLIEHRKFFTRRMKASIYIVL